MYPVVVVNAYYVRIGLYCDVKLPVLLPIPVLTRRKG